ncbi:CAP domain-containing protein [Streptomyces sp. NPDC048106]|uniref:CAP domain-containing protein n=1 Tax=Streptomyces sp. NPDC048106 TaxID=3155750 RepID=UPI00345311DC
MGKHRKTQYFRRMVIGTVALGTVGVPSVALACTDWPDGVTEQGTAAATVASTLAQTQTPAPAGTPQQTATAPQAGIPQGIPGQRVWHQHPRHLPKARATTAPATPRTATPRTAGTAPRAATTAAQPAATGAPAPAPTTSSTPTTAPAATTTPTTPTAPAATTAASGVTAQIVQLVNAERAKAGCQPLTLNAKLTKAAQDHSADMAAHQNMSHTGSDGSDPGTRITAAGYTWSAYGENVAYGYSTAGEVMAGWMASPGHRANILDCGFQEIGVGLAQPGSYWTQDFGTAR